MYRTTSVTHVLNLHRWGKLKLKTISLEIEKVASAQVSLGGKSVAANLARDGKKVLLTLKTPVDFSAGEKLEIELT